MKKSSNSSEPIPRRKGAARRSDISEDILAQLNDGTLETATLSEALAIDFAALLKVVAPELSRKDVATIDPGLGVTRRMKRVGDLLARQYGLASFDQFACHRSDTVRGWAAFLVASVPKLPIRRRLKLIRPLADDPHFGVREWAWLALRDAVAEDFDPAKQALISWTTAPSENLRRFASEITRPRGVWCSHINPLKTEPGQALELLEPLRSDPSLYVRNSVANWLNDAGKSRGDWVRSLCHRWLLESPTAETRSLVKRALRNL